MKDVLHVPRTDPVYNMHGYLTKVPVNAIIPFIEEFTQAGDTVVDIFAGSGMTAIAAKMCSRNAIVSDISILGKHIGLGYLIEVPTDLFVATAELIVNESKTNIGHLYETNSIDTCDVTTQIRTIWSFVYECPHCNKEVNYYHMLESSRWDSSKMQCPHCNGKFEKRKSTYLYDYPVKTVIKNASGKQVEKDLDELDWCKIEQARILDIKSIIPNNEITPDREMFRRSALQKWKTTNTRDFFSDRNAAILHDLWSRINAVTDESLRHKLMFCFTAILPRASKRYQWSRKAPLNAANQNYYIAPVFYEWNVYELFQRKIAAAIKANDYIKSRNKATDSYPPTHQRYVTCSATELSHLEDESVSLVFTDPPFGSNIFYADMNLFQEAWLNDTTDHVEEAVMHTGGGREKKEQSKSRYEDMLTVAFSESYRVLRPGGVFSIVFGNSKGDIWSIAQRAIKNAGFRSKPIRINILDKGQRSVKGLASGTESTATLDLIISYRKPEQERPETPVLYTIDDGELISSVVSEHLNNKDVTVSHLYLEVLREALYRSMPVDKLDLKLIQEEILSRGLRIDPMTGKVLL